MGKLREPATPNFIYQSFRNYFRWCYDWFFYSRTYYLHKEHIPANGTPILVVSNHQNCLNDALGILFTFHKRKPFFVTRADVFGLHPTIRKLLLKMGLLPAFRLDYDGEDTLGGNQETFQVAGQKLLEGHTVVIFPEATHQDRHWLGSFSLGYTQLAFEAARAGNFETDIQILPSCNHYTDYYRIRKQMLVKYGTPISLKPFYDLYRIKPRTAQREVNALVRQQIENLMLLINDTEHYEAIDFLRNTYGKLFACQHGYSPDLLPQRLLSDQQLVAVLEQWRVSEQSGSMDQIFEDTLKLKAGIERLQIDDSLFDKAPSGQMLLLRLFFLVTAFPLGLFSVWPHFFCPVFTRWLMPLIQKKEKDRMLYSSVYYASIVLVAVPILYPMASVGLWIFSKGWIAWIYFVLLPFLGIFAWYYWEFFRKTKQAFRFWKLKEESALLELKELRVNIYNKLNKRLG